MKFRRCSKTVLLLLLSAVFVTIPCVLAAWSYAVGLPEAREQTLPVRLKPFAYPPEEILPQDPDHAENHLDIINAILTEPNGGLNSRQGNKATFLPQNLQDCGGVLYCRQKVTGGNLMNLFTPVTAANVYFTLHAVSNTEIAAYTMSKPTVDSSGVGDAVIVYRTVIKKTGNTWQASETVIGHAYLKAVRVNGLTILSFDPRLNEWHEGETPVL